MSDFIIAEKSKIITLADNIRSATGGTSSLTLDEIVEQASGGIYEEMEYSRANYLTDSDGYITKITLGGPVADTSSAKQPPLNLSSFILEITPNTTFTKDGLFIINATYGDSEKDNWSNNRTSYFTSVCLINNEEVLHTLVRQERLHGMSLGLLKQKAATHGNALMSRFFSPEPTSYIHIFPWGNSDNNFLKNGDLSIKLYGVRANG